jgi:hypothetical protein
MTLCLRDADEYEPMPPKRRQNEGRETVMPEAGKYYGRILRSKVDVTRNGCVQFVAVLNLTRYEGEPLPVPFNPTAYLSLTKNNGERNIGQMNSLMAALGWDGVSLKVLNSTDWSNIDLDVIMKWDEFNGERKLKVAWINAVGSVQTLKETPPEVIDKLDAFWGGDASAKPEPRPAKASSAGPSGAFTDDIPEESIPF